MAKIIGQIDSLRRLLDIFYSNEIYIFNDLEKIKIFIENYSNLARQKEIEAVKKVELELRKQEEIVSGLKRTYENLIAERAEKLISNKSVLETNLANISTQPTSLFKGFVNRIRRFFLKRKIKNIDKKFETKTRKPYNKFKIILDSEEEKLSMMQSNFIENSEKQFKYSNKQFLMAKSIIKEHYSLYLGALGEQKVAKELKSLPNSYSVINGLTINFERAIYKRNSDEHIMSIQADHIVIGPGGVFLIETKNWSKTSIERIDYYSPVDQLKRAGYALFILLNHFENHPSFLPYHHWGQKKISVKNILLMINNKPDIEFQYVKTLKLKEVVNYINYFKPILTNNEVDTITDFLLSLSDE